MSNYRRISIVVLIALAAILSFRAYRGVVASVAVKEFRMHAANADYELAKEAARPAMIGIQRSEVSWLLGEVLMGEWDWTDLSYTEAEPLLEESQSLFESTARMVPTSPWPWLGLSDNFRRQKIQREQQGGLDLGLLGMDGWQRLGREGMIAVGSARHATELAPNRYESWDRLIRLYLYLNLESEAIEAASRAAKAQPDHRFYDFLRDPLVTEPVIEAFHQSAESSLGTLPMMTKEMHLISLARLAIFREQHQKSLEYLEQAKEIANYSRTKAQIQYWMGLAHQAMDQMAEARSAFSISIEHPHFERNSLTRLAAIDRAEGDYGSALKRYGELRKREPQNLEWVKLYAEVARSMARFDAAREALMWWKQKAHHDPRPRVQLIELLGEMGDIAAARRELQELSRLELVSQQQIEALDSLLTEALQGS